RVPFEHLLELVLWDPLAVLRVALVALGRALQRVLEARDGEAREARREDDVGRVVDAERRGLRELLGDAPAPQVLARARVRGLRGGRVGGSGPGGGRGWGGGAGGGGTARGGCRAGSPRRGLPGRRRRPPRAGAGRSCAAV